MRHDREDLCIPCCRQLTGQRNRLGVPRRHRAPRWEVALRGRRSCSDDPAAWRPAPVKEWLFVAGVRNSVEPQRVAGDGDGTSKGHTEGGEVVAGLAHEGQP